MQEIILTGVVSGSVIAVALVIWDMKLEGFVRKALRKHIENEAKKSKVVFIDPR